VEFECDPEKAAENPRKHGVTFTECLTIFGDPLEVMIPDPDHSEGEMRFLSLGRSAPGRLLVVSYTERGHESGSSAPGRRLQRKDESHPA
jgi:hypothetical protein